MRTSRSNSFVSQNNFSSSQGRNQDFAKWEGGLENGKKFVTLFCLRIFGDVI